MSLRPSVVVGKNGGGVVRSSSSSSSEEKEAEEEKQGSLQANEDQQRRLLAEDTGYFSMIRALHLADLITEMNGFCGFMSILSSLRYCLGPADDHTNVYIALALIPFGLFFDFMDGKVARWRGKSSLMGQELDSLADLISFGVAPAVAAFALGLRTPIDTVLLSFFVLCGLTRLARFNVTVSSLPKDSTGKSKYFEGFPIPTSLSIVAGMAVATWCGRVAGGDRGEDVGLVGGVVGAGTGSGKGEAYLAWHPIALVFVVWGCAMVSRRIHIPKP